MEIHHDYRINLYNHRNLTSIYRKEFEKRKIEWYYLQHRSTKSHGFRPNNLWKRWRIFCFEINLSNVYLLSMLYFEVNHIQPIDLYQNMHIGIENLYPIQLSNYVRVIFDKSKMNFIIYSLFFNYLLRNTLKFLLLSYMVQLKFIKTLN